MSWAQYKIEMRDGSVVEMTSKEISERSGITLGTVRKRIAKGYRTYARLAESTESAKARGRQAFLRGTEAHFAELKTKRAAEAAHEDMVRDGNPVI